MWLMNFEEVKHIDRQKERDKEREVLYAEIDSTDTQATA